LVSLEQYTSTNGSNYNSEEYNPILSMEVQKCLTLCDELAGRLNKFSHLTSELPLPPEIRFNIQTMQQELPTFKLQLNKLHTIAQRSELLQRKKSVTNESGIIHVDHLYQEQQSLKRSQTTAASITEMGTGILSNLKIQRETLMSTRNTLINIADSLGISARLLKTIKRRETVDKIIVYGGMLLVLVVLFGLYYLLKF